MKALALFLLFSTAPAAALADGSTLFDPKPAHPWNQLYAALFSVAPVDKFAGPRAPAQWDELDPRLTGEGYQHLLATLDSFLSTHAEKLATAPVKRALLQSALWATFDEVSDPRGRQRAERNEIARRCAVIIRRLSLSDAEIAALPDNYAVTVKQGSFPTDYDAEHHERAFLPPDLLNAKGSWVMMGGEVLEPAAIQHVKLVQGRSVFYVLIRLPGRRSETLEYLRALANFQQPYIWNKMYAQFPYARSPVELNPELPELPKGTQVALVRRMMLTNSAGELVVTPVTESLQIRVYVKDPKEAQWGELENQAYYQFRVLPAELLAGSGGLGAKPVLEREPMLAFEEPSMFRSGACSDCHAPLGVRSLHTYTHMMGPPRVTPWFDPSRTDYEDKNTMNWKKHDFSWGLLQGFFASMPANAKP